MIEFPYICLVIARIKHKLNRRRIVKALGSFDEEAFWKATSIGHSEYITILVEAGIGINSQNDRGKTALMLAAEKGQAEIISLLLSLGASVDLGDHEQMTALMIAGKEGHIDCVEALLNAGAEVNTRDEDGLTALMVSVKEGNTAIVRCLLKAKADPNAKDNEGKHVISYAKFSPSLEKILQESGAEAPKEPVGEVVDSIPYLGQNVKNIIRTIGDGVMNQEQVATFYEMIQNLGLLLQFKRNPEELNNEEINEQFVNFRLGIDILIKLRNIVMDFASIVMALYNKSQDNPSSSHEFFEELTEVLDAIDQRMQELELQIEDKIQMEIMLPHEATHMKEIILMDWLVEEGEYVEMGQQIAILGTEDGKIELKAIQSGKLKHILRSGAKIKAGEPIGLIDPQDDKTKVA